MTLTMVGLAASCANFANFGLGASTTSGPSGPALDKQGNQQMTRNSSIAEPDKTPSSSSPANHVLGLEVFTDLHCPWCYMGKRRLDRALAQFEHRDRVRVVWRSFVLHPRAPRKYDGTVYDLVARRYGMSLEKAVAMHDELEVLAAQEGLQYRFAQAKPGNSLDGHRLVHLGARHNLAGVVEERLMRGYFSEGVHLGDHAELSRLAVEAGLDRAEVRSVLASDEFVDEVQADALRASTLGLRGVPAFVINETLVLPRNQTAESLVAALRAAWEHTAPAQEARAVVGCDDGACAVRGY